jgi:AcrR family transcriptional regulator
MTEKKEQILISALTLFSEMGYTATSTSKIAKDAKVSEALIFRHFENKEGLLQAVLAIGDAKVKLILTDIIFEENPKQLIKKVLCLPFGNILSEQEFWRLQFKLQWELKTFSDDKMKPLELALRNAFAELNYEDPVMEAEFVIYFLEGLASALLKGTLKTKRKCKHFY